MNLLVRFFRLLPALLLPCLVVACRPAARLDGLTCDYRQYPLALDEAAPRFGWQWKVRGDASDSLRVRQSAYRVEVTDAAGQVVWNSGRVESQQSQGVVYEGEPLRPMAEYTWRVEAWDALGRDLGWSKPACFKMAPAAGQLLGQWIGAITRADSRLPEGRGYEGNTVNRYPEMKAAWNATDTLSRKSLLLRKEFVLDGPVRRAYAYVSGLGHYEMTLNGCKVSDGLDGAAGQPDEVQFAPLWSDYDKTVYYNVYDVTALLRDRGNAVGVLLGNGFYNEQGGRYRKLLVSFGPPTLWCQIRVEYADGRTQDIVSDASWTYDFSPLTFNDMYGGEDYDARLEQKGWNLYGFDDAAWRPAVVQEGPAGRLTAQQAPAVTMQERYGVKASWPRTYLPKPKKSAPWTLTGDSLSVTVLDMGQNLAGFPVIRVKGRRGDTVRLLVGESLSADSLVSQTQSGGPYAFSYTLKGEDSECWHPRFSYYGYRYIEVQGAVLKGQPNPLGLPVLENIESCFVSNSAPVIGSFESSDELFNGVHRLIQMAVRSNMQGVFTDCPHREKLGWLEQLQLNANGLLYNYDLTTLWPKIMQDMADAQYPSGLVPTTAPMYTEFPPLWNDSPEWGSSSVILPFLYYERYGDDRLIRRFYPTMKRYVDYLEASSDGLIVRQGLGDWYDFGPERPGFAQNTPVPLSGTAHFYQDARLVARAAAMIGLTDEAEHYEGLAEEINAAFHREYFRADSCIYGTGSQSSYALPLAMGMVAPENYDTALQHLLADIDAHGGRLTTGEVGNGYMFPLLEREGYNDVLWRMHHHREVPGYGYQLQFGATTLTEQWDPRQGASWNHFMLGALDSWFFSGLGGIAFDPACPGGQHLIIRPAVAHMLTGDLRACEVSTRTLYGEVGVSWRWAKSGDLLLEVTLPGNTTADLPSGPGVKVKLRYR